MQIEAEGKKRLIVPYACGALKLVGADAFKLLQGQLTINVDKLVDGVGQLAAHCNPQGRVISLFYLFKQTEAFYLFMPKEMLAIAKTALDKYAIFYKINLTLLEEDLVFELNIAANPIEQPPILKAIINKEVATITSFEAWHSYLLNHGIPTLTPKSTAYYLPHDLNLPALNAVDFNKGCFTGQEIIARMHYRGNLKKSLQHAEIAMNASPAINQPIYDEGVEIGTVVDVLLNDDRKCYEALILLPSTKKSRAPLHLTLNAHTLTLNNETF